MRKAKDIMSKDVISVRPDLAIEKLAALLWEKKIGGVPVVDENGSLLGVVTESDLIDQTKNVHIPTVISILDSVMFLESPQKMDKEIQKMAGRTVGDIFSPELITVDEKTSLSEIATLMSEKNIHTVPVLAAGELVGVVGKSDLIRAISLS